MYLHTVSMTRVNFIIFAFMKQILPVGLQSFKKVREGHFMYIDKTKIIHRLTRSGNYFFLSRPRRFGKSLTVNTLESLFKGEKQYFQGLYIEDKWDWSQKYPVARSWNQL